MQRGEILLLETTSIKLHSEQAIRLRKPSILGARAFYLAG